MFNYCIDELVPSGDMLTLVNKYGFDSGYVLELTAEQAELLLTQCKSDELG